MDTLHPDELGLKIYYKNVNVDYKIDLIISNYLNK